MAKNQQDQAINSEFNRIVKERAKASGGIKNVNFAQVYETIAKMQNLSVMTVRRTVCGY